MCHEPSQVYGFDYWGEFEANEEYTIEIDFPSSADWDVHWHIGRAETISITEGTDYTSNLAKSQEYKFVPEKTGYYFISSDDTGESSVYDSSMQTTDVRPGTTIEVQEAFELNNATSPIEVEITEAFLWNDPAEIAYMQFTFD